MTTDNKDGLFSKIKKAMDAGQAPEPVRLENNKDQYKQELKEKYEAIAKSVVKKREQKLNEQFQSEVNEISEEAKRQQKLMAATWHSQVASLQQELAHQKQVLQSSVDQAMDAGRAIGQNMVEEKCAQLIRDQEEHLKREYNNFLVQQQNLKTQIAKECLKQEELIREKQLLNQKIILLENELAKMKPSVEENVQRVRAEIKLEMQSEFDAKMDQYKKQIDIAKNSEIQRAILLEKQRIVAESEQQNFQALKQRERELHNEFELKIMDANNKVQELQFTISRLEQEKNSAQAEVTVKQQDLLAQERIRLNELHANELQALRLQQQSMQESHRLELAALAQQHQVAIEQAVNRAIDMREQDLELVRMQCEREKGEELAKAEYELRREFQEILTQQRKKTAQHFAKQLEEELKKAINAHRNKSEDQLCEEYAVKWQQHLELVKQEIAQEKLKLHQHYEAKLQQYLVEHEKGLRQEYERDLQQKLAELAEQELKKLNAKFAQEKALFIKELGERYNHEKRIEMQNYENELRDSLYKEMVKQKVRIQEKFAKGQQAALDEQRRRLEAQHRHQIERLSATQNAFSHEMLASKAKRNELPVDRSVDELAERILAKFQNGKDVH